VLGLFVVAIGGAGDSRGRAICKKSGQKIHESLFRFRFGVFWVLSNTTGFVEVWSAPIKIRFQHNYCTPQNQKEMKIVNDLFCPQM
jgi:hypothetical protein